MYISLLSCLSAVDCIRGALLLLLLCTLAAGDEAAQNGLQCWAAAPACELAVRLAIYIYWPCHVDRRASKQEAAQPKTRELQYGSRLDCRLTVRRRKSILQGRSEGKRACRSPQGVAVAEEEAVLPHARSSRVVRLEAAQAIPAVADAPWRTAAIVRRASHASAAVARLPRAPLCACASRTRRKAAQPAPVSCSASARERWSGKGGMPARPARGRPSHLQRRGGRGQDTISVEVPLCVVNALEQQESNAFARGRSARARRGARPARLRRRSGAARAPLRRFGSRAMPSERGVAPRRTIP